MKQKNPKFTYNVKIGNKTIIICSSVLEASKQSGIPEDTLKHYFFRLKATKVTRNDIEIEKKVKIVTKTVSYE